MRIRFSVVSVGDDIIDRRGKRENAVGKGGGHAIQILLAGARAYFFNSFRTASVCTLIVCVYVCMYVHTHIHV